MQLLLTNGAHVNLCDEMGSSPLRVACFNGHTITVQLLLKYDVDVKVCEKGGRSPFNTACDNGNARIVHLLLDNNAEAHRFDVR